jgi:cysteinyl-tRNA synthetase
MRRLSENLERTGKKTLKVKEYVKNFFKAVNDDLNMPKVLTLVWKIVRKEIEMNNREKYELLLAFDKILAIDIAKEVTTDQLPLKIEELIKKRERARKNQDWETADELRDEIKKRGYLLEDTSEGIRWRKI